MSDISERIKNANDKINRTLFAQEQNAKIIQSVKDSLLRIELNETSKKIINIKFPELIDTDYINTLQELSYEELIQFRDKLKSCIEYMMSMVEESLS